MVCTSLFCSPMRLLRRFSVHGSSAGGDSLQPCFIAVLEAGSLSILTLSGFSRTVIEQSFVFLFDEVKQHNSEKSGTEEKTTMNCQDYRQKSTLNGLNNKCNIRKTWTRRCCNIICTKLTEATAGWLTIIILGVSNYSFWLHTRSETPPLWEGYLEAHICKPSDTFLELIRRK